MSTKEDFGFEKLNRVPKKIIQGAIEEFRKKNPGLALNRMDLCFIVSENLEKSYLKVDSKIKGVNVDSETEGINVDSETEEINVDSEVEGINVDFEVEERNDEKKKNYNGQHILKKMGLDTTKKILRKIDFYIYKYYSEKKIEI